MAKYCALINEGGHEDVRVDIEFDYDEYYNERFSLYPHDFGSYYTLNRVEVTEVKEAYLVREGIHELYKEDIPKIKGICEVEPRKGYFIYSHKKPISKDSWLVEMACRQAEDRWDWVEDKKERVEDEDSEWVCIQQFK